MKKTNIMGKEEYLSFRTSSEVKKILQELADQGYRTLSQQCEMIITEWLKEAGFLEQSKRTREREKKGKK